MVDLILYNGKIHTQDPARPQATAVAISGGLFGAVGDDDEIRALAGPRTQSMDLGGRRVLPGLVDGHFHFYDWSLALRQVPLPGVSSLQEMCRRVAAAAAQAPKGTWIQGRGWNETLWPSPELPTRAVLDGACPDHPAILFRNDMHLAVANTRALQAAGITADTPDPAGGVIDRGADGRPTGLLRDIAMNLVSQAIPSPTDVEAAAAMAEGAAILNSLGLTGLHDFRVMGGICGQPAFRAWQRLHEQGRLTLRAWVHLPGERRQEAIALGLRSGFGDGRLRIGHLKFFVDGSQGARTAWMLEPYEDGGCGIPLTPVDEIVAAVREAEDAGLACAIHAIGDRAMRELLGGLEQSYASRPAHRNGSVGLAAPHRIEHVQIIQSDDVPRLAGLGIVASVQPLQATDDIPMVESSIGSRSRFAYTFRTLAEAGVPLVFGSDCPVADPNPMLGIHAAVTRQRGDGSPVGGWYPEQRLDVAQAVWGYTMGSALVCGRTHELGSITPGKLADLTVLDRDIFSIDPIEIVEVHADMTVLGGEIIFER